MFFVVLSTVCATEIADASNKEYSNLTNDDAIALSQGNLEVSNEDSISETNLVNSHDDNLNDYPKDDVLLGIADSYYEDNGEQTLCLANDDVENTLSVSNDDSVVSVSSQDNLLTAKKTTSKVSAVATKLTVSDTHYSKSNTAFRVTLQDSAGNDLSYKKITLKVKNKVYTGKTNILGIAIIRTDALPIGTYSVTVSYAGNANYSSKSLTKNIKVLSSVSGKDVTKYYGSSTYYTATFYQDYKALASTKVTFDIGGKKYTYKTNSKGVATVKADLKPGKYTITATNPFSNEVLKNNLVINKDKTTIAGKSSEIYVLTNNAYTYTVTLTSANGGPVNNAKVTFSYDGRTATATTNSQGKASTKIPVLKNGSYAITYKFAGNEGYQASSSSGTYIVKGPDNKLTASDLKMTYNDGSKFSVKLTTTKNKALSGKTIKFQINNQTYTAKTGSGGVAKLAIGDLKPGTYKIKYMYSTLGASDYNYGYKNVVIDKLTVNLLAYNLVMKYNDGSTYKATVKDSAGKVLKNVPVKFTINGNTYTQKTDAKGVAKLKITDPVGYYLIKSTVSSGNYKSSTISKHVLVNGTKFNASNMNVVSGKSVTFSVKLIDGKNISIKNAAVKFTFNGKTYNVKTDSEGIASVGLGKLAAGTYKIKYVSGSSSGTKSINVVDKVTLKQVISASKTVRNYVYNNYKLPSSVKIGNIQLTISDYLYLASEAIVNLKAGKTADIPLKSVKAPDKPGAASDMGNLYDYLSVAKSIIKTADSNGQMPDSVKSDVGNIGFKGLVYAFARVVAFYDDEGVMPSYVAIKSTDDTSPTTSSLNSKNTITNLAPYLAASTNCQVNNTKIKELVTKLTKGLTSDKAKATAIYNYVRDTISYSFYYDTRYGAVGTLNAKTGNCVDHSHLLVAMYRTAGLAARYVHGTCTFSSGTYGHVWTQVLIGDTWIVSDATSTRNSFGNVVNWNSHTYSLKGYYPSIGF